MEFKEPKFQEQKLFETKEDALFINNRINFINGELGRLASMRNKIGKEWDSLLAERVMHQINIDRYLWADGKHLPQNNL